VPVDSRSVAAAAEQSLERLFRLTAGRRMYARQSVAVGAVVSRAGYTLLRTLAEADDCTMTELARLCDMDAAAAGRQLTSLETEGLVSRSTDAGDGRVVRVGLTAEGRRTCERIIAVRTEHMAKVLAGWPEAERVALTELVDRLVEDLKATPFRPTPERP
jgi:DNA-binding MarR family transcriptional regulator